MALIYESEWLQTTGITSEEAANRAREMFNLYLNSGNDGECGDMACCDDQVILHRIDPETGRPQVSKDGGATWSTDPDDVQNKIQLYPPTVFEGSTGTRCDAATNASEHINELITATGENLSAAATIFDLAVAVAEAALVAFLVFVTGGVASPLVLTLATSLWAAAAGAFALGIAAYNAYWTTDKQDAILCALYCRIGEDGQFTEEQYQAWRTDIKGTLPASPAFDIVMTAINAGGARGLSQMASYGNAAAADCASCGCDCADAWGFETSGYSTVISIDNDTCTYVLQSVENVAHPGQQIIGFDFGMGCATVDIHESAGANQYPSWYPCGGSGEITRGLYGTQSVNYMYLENTAGTVFQATFIITSP